MKIKSFLALSLLALCARGFGCNASVDGRYPVSGTVNFDGKPMDFGQISFQPADPSLQSSSAAQIDGGKFEIPANKGLLPGEYTIVFQREEPTGEKVVQDVGLGKTEEIEVMKSFIPEEWGFRSTQKVTIEPKNNRLKFDVPRSPEPVEPPALEGSSSGI